MSRMLRGFDPRGGGGGTAMSRVLRGSTGGMFASGMTRTSGTGPL